MNEATRKRNRTNAREYRLDELEQDYDALIKQMYRMAWRQEEIKQELKDAKEETKQHLDTLGDLLHNRFFWLMLVVLAGLFFVAVLVVDFRMDLWQLLGT